jgi:hypothetical protein
MIFFVLFSVTIRSSRDLFIAICRIIFGRNSLRNDENVERIAIFKHDFFIRYK